MRVLLTGAGGFVGPHALAALRARGHVVTPVGSPRHQPAVEWVVDLTDADATLRLIEQRAPEVVIHLAARSRPSGLDALGALFDNNVRAAASVLEATRRAAPRARVIVASSSAVYGAVPPERNPVTEDMPPQPLLPYGASKVAVEGLASVYRGQGLDVVVVRPFNLIGAGQDATFVLAGFARQIMRAAARQSKAEIETGPLERVRDFLDVRDAAEAYAALVERPVGFGPLNLCSGVPRRLGDVLGEMMALAGVTAAIRPNPGAGTPGRLDVPYQCGSRIAMMHAVDWQPQVPWKRTLGDLLEDWRDRIDAEGR